MVVCVCVGGLGQQFGSKPSLNLQSERSLIPPLSLSLFPFWGSFFSPLQGNIMAAQKLSVLTDAVRPKSKL